MNGAHRQVCNQDDLSAAMNKQHDYLEIAIIQQITKIPHDDDDNILVSGMTQSCLSHHHLISSMGFPVLVRQPTSLTTSMY